MRHALSTFAGSGRAWMTILVIACVATASAQSEDAQRRRNFNTDLEIAMRGFDPVSYFIGGKPLKGNSRFYHHYKGITYYFANAENLEAFREAPPKYEPAYGGWCAYTVALNGERVKVDPTTFKIIDGKLHLFYNFGGDNRLLKWNRNEAKLQAAARKNWVAGMH